jgi:anti-sigma regulatory factor (Ser/Thr protein kinase)
LTGLEQGVDGNADSLALSFISGSLPAVASSVTTLRHTVARFASRHGFEPGDVHRIAVAVTEAASNVVLHAYARTQGVLSYVVDVADDDLQVVITDDGSGIRKEQESPGLGMGLALIAEMTTDFGIYAREPRGLEVWMRFLPE